MPTTSRAFALECMCLIVVAWRAHPEYSCVIAANRDEFHSRPTTAAQWWPDRPHVLAGRDELAGGTWLGVTRGGRFAALTNFRGAQRQRADAPSRGALVTSLLDSTESTALTLKRLHETGPDYNGFNVIFSDGQQLAVHESKPGAGHVLPPGIYGLSNHLLDTPWPKVRNLKSRLQAALGDLAHPDAVLALLRDDTPAADEELPRTGISLEWERLLSSAFVRAAEYGTRCSTLIRIGKGEVFFDEWTWNRDAACVGRVSLHFDRA